MTSPRRPRRPRRLRPADVGRASLGVVLLARPGTAVRLTRSRGGRDVERVVRVLGVRYLVQSAAGLTVRQPWVRTLDTSVDVVHAASMVGLALIAPRHRRLAMTSAVLAVTFAALDETERMR